MLVKPILPLPEGTGEAVNLSLEQTPLAQSALLSMESSTGYVVAMVGGYDFADSKYNRALQGERQPGSSFKPLLYAAALDKGFTPSSIIFCNSFGSIFISSSFKLNSKLSISS